MSLQLRGELQTHQDGISLSIDDPKPPFLKVTVVGGLDLIHKAIVGYGPSRHIVSFCVAEIEEILEVLAGVFTY